MHLASDLQGLSRGLGRAESLPNGIPLQLAGLEEIEYRDIETRPRPREAIQWAILDERG